MSEDMVRSQKIATLFSEHLNLKVPDIDTDLIEEGILDSLTLVNLLMHIEQEFGVIVTVENLEIDNFRSIANITEFVTKNNGTIY